MCSGPASNRDSAGRRAVGATACADLLKRANAGDGLAAGFAQARLIQQHLDLLLQVRLVADERSLGVGLKLERAALRQS